ncbi:hypothetical protein [Pseudomonas putida]|uniref:Uncharacterized protein n=1 Tax=Pseudomonas putida TaxID=303 RepID=A0A1L7NPR9_PSEPU|nr:hypothetical protein [Pseudomonas putida]BAW27469.1 Uncharacterized protein KF715C_pC360 [Pseudomonas putida]
MELIPLQRSAAADDVEAEFKALFMKLFKDRLGDSVNDLAMYGMPHIGSIANIERYISADGLAVLRTTTVEQIRYLFHAWRYNNPQRGTAFLSTYLNVLFGPVFTISQLWCHKNAIYPEECLAEYEVKSKGGNFNDYYLTSRLRVDIETNLVPERILRAARTAVAAKFVLELRAAQRILFSYGIAMINSGVTVCRTSGSSTFSQPNVEAAVTVGVATLADGTAVGVWRTSGSATFSQPNVEAETAVGVASATGGSGFTYATGSDAQSHLI